MIYGLNSLDGNPSRTAIPLAEALQMQGFRPIADSLASFTFFLNAAKPSHFPGVHEPPTQPANCTL